MRWGKWTSRAVAALLAGSLAGCGAAKPSIVFESADVVQLNAMADQARTDGEERLREFVRRTSQSGQTDSIRLVQSSRSGRSVYQDVEYNGVRYNLYVGNGEERRRFASCGTLERSGDYKAYYLTECVGTEIGAIPLFSLEQVLPELQLAVVGQGDGSFRVKHDGHAVSESLFAPEGAEPWVAHAVSRAQPLAKGGYAVREDVVVVDPERRSIRQAVLAELVTDEVQKAERTVGLIGVVDEQRLLYVGLENDEESGKLRTSIRELDVRTMESRILADDVLPEADYHRLTNRLLLPEASALFIGTDTGVLREINLKTGASVRIAGTYPSGPNAAEVKFSPSGAYFEYRGNVYGLSGERLSAERILPEGRQSAENSFVWGPYEVLVAAGYAAGGGSLPQQRGIVFATLTGQPVLDYKVQPGSGRNVEVASWEQADTVVIREYSLEEDGGATGEATDELYYRMRLPDGTKEQIEGPAAAPVVNDQRSRSSGGRWEATDELQYTLRTLSASVE